jgi:tetratricopeptide (TPR) repeat protein
LGVLVICLSVLAAYWPALRGGFIWDDTSLVTGNDLIKADDGLHRFWFTTESADFWPVTMTSFWFEWRLWGPHAAGYHATNLVLHVMDTLLIWAILRRLRLPGAFIAAMLFAVHPVNVESVAWIAERKNLLAMLFFLVSILFFLKADLASGEPPPRTLGARRLGFYWLSLVAFALAMLSKGSVAPLPAVLAGLIAWRRRLSIRDAMRLAPFLLIAVSLALVDVWFQGHGSAAVIRGAGAIERLLGAGAAVCFYLYKAIFPAGLVFIYPQWRIDPANPLGWAPLLAVLGATAGLWRMSRPRLPNSSGAAPTGLARGAFFGWGYFCVMLVPVMGFTDVYFMKFSLVADHYEHLAIVGVVAIAAAAWSAWNMRSPVARPAAVAIVVLLAGLTWRQCRLYRDEETLYTATLADNPDSWVAHSNLATVLAAGGRLPEAVAHYEAALRLGADSPETYNSFGNALARLHRLPEAFSAYGEALRLSPGFAIADCDWGNALSDAGRLSEARARYEAALRLRPDYPEALYGLANVLANTGALGDAIAHYRKALQIRGDYAEAHANLGLALATANRAADALPELAAAIRLRPAYAEAHAYLGFALARLGRLTDAAGEYREALRLNPGDRDTHYQLGMALQALGKPGEAAVEFKAAETPPSGRPEP